MKAFDVRAYSISDFQEWHRDGKLELSPKFQAPFCVVKPRKSILGGHRHQGKAISQNHIDARI